MKTFYALLATALAGGCASTVALVRQHEPSSEFEAGSVTISASAPMRWEEVVDDLRPELHSASAREHMSAAISTTSREVSSRRSAVAVEAGVNVRGETITRSGERVRRPDDATTGDVTTTYSQEAPDAVTLNGVAAPTAGTFQGNPLAAPTTAPPGEVAVDRILQTRAAVAVHQEWAMLDNYLDHAYDHCLQEGWLVRTRLVATPYARNQPFDVYSRINVGYSNGSRTRWDGLRVVPLLVTDNFERSDSRRYEEAVAQLEASMNGLTGVVAAGLGFNRYLNNLNSVLGAQYNNLLSISQIEEDTLSIRLGAPFSPTSRHEMQSRSYDITFLVLIDRTELDEVRRTTPSAVGSNGAATSHDVTLRFFVSSDLMHAETGAVLEPITPGARRQLIERLREHINDDGGNRQAHEALDKLENPREPGDVWSAVEDIDRVAQVPETLYGQLLRWALAAEGAYATLPVSTQEIRLPREQHGVFRDSLDGGLSARVVGVPGLSARRMDARLLVEPLRLSEPDRQPPLSFVARSLSVNSEGVVEAIFPSLGALGVDADGAQVQLELSDGCGRADAAGPISYPLLRDLAAVGATPPRSPSFASRAVTAHLTPSGDTNDAIARVTILGIENRNNPYVAGYVISVSGEGAGVVQRATRLGEGGSELPPNAINPGANSVRVGRDFGAYNLALTNLVPNKTITITVDAMGADGGVIEGESVDYTIAVGARPS